jgi:hypothetical protein
MEQRLAKLRPGIPNSRDPMVDPVGEAIVGALVGEDLREILWEKPLWEIL